MEMRVPRIARQTRRAKAKLLLVSLAKLLYAARSQFKIKQTKPIYFKIRLNFRPIYFKIRFEPAVTVTGKAPT